MALSKSRTRRERRKKVIQRLRLNPHERWFNEDVGEEPSDSKSATERFKLLFEISEAFIANSKQKE